LITPRKIKVEIENTRIPIIQFGDNNEESPIPLPTGISVKIKSPQAIKYTTEVKGMEYPTKSKA
jgi:hypothetical protein